MKLESNLIKTVPTSATIGMAETARRLEANGVKIIHFEIGEPDFTTPENIIESTYQQMKNGQTHYTSSRGVPQLCDAIARHEEAFGIHADPKKNIILTPGSKFAIYAFLRAVIDPGDEVVIVSPAWPTYTDIVNMVGATPIHVAVEESLHLNEEATKKAVRNKTRLIIINSPNNPTGGVLDKKDLGLIRDLALDGDFLVMSDEVYKMMVYDGVEYTSIASLPGMEERTMTINGFSKTYAMTGWRLGYAIGDERIIENMIKLQTNITTCPTSFIQLGSVEALDGPQDFVKKMLEEYNRRREVSIRLLRTISAIKFTEPKGAFYLFPDISSFGKSDQEVSKGLLEKGVAVTAGTPFGLGGRGHIRISYATGLNNITEGMQRMRSYFESL